MSVVNEARDALGLSRRRRLFGLPVGPKQTDWMKIAVGAGGATIIGVAGNRLLGSSDAEASKHGNGSKDLRRRGRSLAQKRREMMQQDGEPTESPQQIGDKMSAITQGKSMTATTFRRMKGAVQSMDQNGDEAGQDKKQRLIIQEQIDVAVPRKTAYERWTDFDSFEGISRAVQKAEPSEEGDKGSSDEASMEWRARILVSTRHWTANITDQTPEKRIAWETEGDVEHSGAVTFHRLAENLTRIHVEMEYHPTGFTEKFGNLFLTVRHRVRKDLRLFRHHLEMEGAANGQASIQPASAGQQSGQQSGQSGQQSGQSGQQSPRNEPSRRSTSPS